MKVFLFLILFLPFSTYSSDLKLVGSALLEYSIFKFDVYEIAYYKSPTLKLEQMVLTYKMDISKEISIKGWKEGFKQILKERPQYQNNIKWILKNTKDLKANDVFKITKFENKVTFEINQKIIASTIDPIISKIILSPWIGETPLDQDLKNKLLNLKES